MIILTRDESPLVYRVPVVSEDSNFDLSTALFHVAMYRQFARKVGTSANSALIRYYYCLARPALARERTPSVTHLPRALRGILERCRTHRCLPRKVLRTDIPGKKRRERPKTRWKTLANYWVQRAPVSERARSRTRKSNRLVARFHNGRNTFRNRQTHTYIALITPTLYPHWRFYWQSVVLVICAK